MTAAEAAANVVVRRFDARDMEEEGEIEEARVVLAIAGLQPASSDTGLAVAAACRRAKVFTRVDAGRGIIAIERREMARWVQNNRKRQEQEARAPAGGGGGAGGASGAAGAGAAGMAAPAGPSLQDQQRAIRLGMSPPDSGGRSSNAPASGSPTRLPRTPF